MSEAFEAWAIVELFGHQKIAGKLTEQTIGGCHFIRVDVPEFADSPKFTKLYTQGAIYAVTFVSEQIARAAAQSYRVAPASVYELRNMLETQGKLLTSSTHGGDPDDDRF
jgi:hypothetical protein